MPRVADYDLNIIELCKNMSSQSNLMHLRDLKPRNNTYELGFHGNGHRNGASSHHYHDACCVPVDSWLSTNIGFQLSPKGALHAHGPLKPIDVHRHPRSRSACGKLQIAARRQAGEQAERKAYPRSFSYDRSAVTSKDEDGPITFLRWPNRGELALSKSGSPLMTSTRTIRQKFVNVNIPTRNGVISMQPKKLFEIDPEMLQSLDDNILSQLEILVHNMQLILKKSYDAASK
ncbi:borealin-like [Scaptodrosophila lebanonensis]|uniref:Borealin-like n=1 Tax=Drosophila lebanonensis TaxID=7225 RepID=A0A6J2TRZ8_DROLE|nr:borealin-like [Scaptodrosophila lebanonensis]